MAVGTHWEWRAFGNPPLAVALAVIGRLKKQFGDEDEGNEHTDEYLWTPGCDVNVKLRDKNLKFKRVLETSNDGCELWTEEADENFPFPLTGVAMDFMATHMNVVPPGDAGAAGQSLAALKEALPRFEPSIQIVPVQKHRIQYKRSVEGATFIVELAEVIAPVQTWSIAIEGENLPRTASNAVEPEASTECLKLIRRVRDDLGLPGSMTVTGYLELLGEWS